jgi:hypothetical protein
MPLIHRPGEAQLDFGFALAKIAGVSLDNLDRPLLSRKIRLVLTGSVKAL